MSTEETCLETFTEAVFRRVQNRKQPKGPSGREQINRSFYSYRILCRKNELLMHAKQVNLKKKQNHAIERRRPHTKRADIACFYLYDILGQAKQSFGNRK